MRTKQTLKHLLEQTLQHVPHTLPSMCLSECSRRRTNPVPSRTRPVPNALSRTARPAVSPGRKNPQYSFTLNANCRVGVRASARETVQR